jgi:hypothetical protein
VKNEAACGEFEQRTGYFCSNFSRLQGLICHAFFILKIFFEKKLDF